MTAVTTLLAELLNDTRSWGEDAACIGKADVLEGDDINAAKALCLGDPTMRRTGDDRWRTADQHLLNMPRAHRDDQTEERELAARAVQRIAGDQATELLDILGLTPDVEAVDTRTKRCTRCQEDKPHDEFYKRPDSRDGLTSQCKTCHNRFRNAARGGRDPLTPGGRGISCGRDAIDDRLTTYKQLIRDGATIRQAAKELGVGERTAHRYHAQLKQRGEL